MGVALTHDTPGRLPHLVTAVARELGDGLLHTTGPCLPGLTLAAQKGWKNTGTLARVAHCGRSEKWGCRERLPPLFKRKWAAMWIGTIRFWASLYHAA